MSEDLYKENMFNVSSLEDVKDDKITLLEKNEDNYSFEYLKDFWKYENGILTQYPDYYSMEKGENGIVVFAPNQGVVKEHGAYIVNSLDNMSYLKGFKNFTLEERKSYIKSEEDKKGLNMPFAIDKKLKDKYEQRINKIDRELNSSVVFKEKDMESVRAMVKATFDVFVVMLTFAKSIQLKSMNLSKKVSNDISQKLDTKEIDPNNLLERKKLEESNPALKDLLKKYDEFVFNMKTNNMPKEEIVKNIVEKALNDDKFISSAEETANNPIIQKQFAEQVDKIRSFATKIKSDLDPNVVYTLDTLKSDEQNNFIKELKNYDLFKLFKENNLQPENYSHQMEVFMSNAILISIVNDDKLDYKNIMTKYVGITDKLDKHLSFDNIVSIASKIATETLEKLDIKIEQKQHSTLKYDSI